MNKIVLITGVTSGFGKAIAETFAANNYNCIITGRRKEKLLQVATELNKNYHIQTLPLVFDVQNNNAVTKAIESIPQQWQSIDVLVNNAGLALSRDSFENASLDDWDTMINTNIKGVLYVSKAVLPFFIQHKKGHIINIGSTAGREVYQNGNVYCASKFAVNAISQSQRIDLLPHSIKVTVVNPGAAETEFSLVRFKGDPQKAKAVYDGYKPLQAQDVANVVFYCATLPPHVCINEVVVTCTSQANSFHTFKK